MTGRRWMTKKTQEWTMQDWAMTEKFAGMGTAGLDYNRQSLC